MGHPAHISLTDRLRGIESEIAAGRAESALPRCLDIATLYPRALAVQRVLGEIYLALRKPREALAALDRALTGDPEDARACCARAIVHQMHGDQLAALSWYHRACDIRPEDATIRATYRELAANLGQPPYQPGRVGLARLYLRGDLLTHAIREWDSLIAENSDSTRLEAHVGLVETLWRAGRDQEAEAWARRTLTNTPSCLKPLLIAGVVAHDEGRDADAEPFLRRAADLDPDHRAARALFADRLGAGDTALGVLIWGEPPPEPPASGAPPTGGTSPATGSPATEDPVASAPWTQPSQGAAPAAGQRVTQPAERRINRPLVSGESVTPGARSRPDLTAPATPLPPPTPRSGDLPPNFHSMFKETEGMLWKPGDSDPDSLRDTVMRNAISATPPASPAPISQPMPAPTTPFSPDTLAPPPAIAESGFALGDTEMRRAIRWVQWLQAQGARSLGDEPQRAQPSSSLEALFNSPPGASQPAAPAPSAASAPPPVPPTLPIVALPSMPSWPSGALASGPLNPPSSADLRQMFAELDPGARSRVEAGEVEAVPVDATPVDAPMEALPVELSPFNVAPVETPAEEVAPAAGSPTEWLAPFAEALNRTDTNVGRDTRRATGAPATPTSQAPDATVEELERQGAADGFTRFTLEPGALAAFAGDTGQAEASATHGDDGDDWLGARAAEPLAPPEPLALPEPLAPPAQFAAPTPEPPVLPMPSIPPAPFTPLAGSAPDATVEELERRGAADGFMPFALEPGGLAAFAGGLGGGVSPASEEEPGDDWLGARAPELELPGTPTVEPPASTAVEAPAESPLAIQPDMPAEQDPHNYVARLEQARGHRDSGALDDAIVEYRTVVRNAPDLLPDVLSDVEGCLAERPEHPELHRLLGDARIRQGDYLGALESYNRAVALSQSLDA